MSELEGKEITNTILQEKLEDNLKGIEVLEDLTGTYKNYEYEIDENFKVHIIGNTSNPITLSIDKKIGTSYITINPQASSTQGNIIKYEYIIDGTIYETNEETFTIENLEPETTHKIKVIVTDEKQNKKETKEITIKTEPRTYLYKEGNEYIELTGGWERGNYNAGSFTKESDHINLYCEAPSNKKYWNSCQTKNSIDVSEYTKIKYKMKIDNFYYLEDEWYGAWMHKGVYNPQFINYDDYGKSTIEVICDSDMSNQIIIEEVDITDINEIVYPTVCFRRWYIGSFVVNVNIYEVWLEK